MIPSDESFKFNCKISTEGTDTVTLGFALYAMKDVHVFSNDIIQVLEKVEQSVNFELALKTSLF